MRGWTDWWYNDLTARRYCNEAPCRSCGMRSDKGRISIALNVWTGSFSERRRLYILRLEIWAGHYSEQTGVMNFHLESSTQVASTISLKCVKFIQATRRNSLIHKRTVYSENVFYRGTILYSASTKVNIRLGYIYYLPEKMWLSPFFKLSNKWSFS